ncbi:MAG TPA: PspC domain-containing protein [Bacillota bacterium]|nr:PspC domain-containing protein [Bacillota bacterium]
MDSKRLTRDMGNKMLGGVCSGVANYFGVDPTLVRIIWAILALGYGAGILAYVICWVIIPPNR